MPDISDIYANAAGGGLSPPADGFDAINPPTLFDGRALFTQVIVAPEGRTVWVSGLIGCTADNRLVEGGKAAQIRQAFLNLRHAMAAGGMDPLHCTRIVEYVVDYDQTDLAVIREGILATFDARRLPTNTLVPVPRLGRDGALFEIEASGVIPVPRR
jgi:enamine deaminase RidA (YjgF/YER057c/UK114 family)